MTEYDGDVITDDRLVIRDRCYGDDRQIIIFRAHIVSINVKFEEVTHNTAEKGKWYQVVEPNWEHVGDDFTVEIRTVDGEKHIFQLLECFSGKGQTPRKWQFWKAVFKEYDIEIPQQLVDVE